MPDVNSNFLIDSTFIFTILFTSYNIFRDGQPSFSLGQIFNIFSLFFLGIAPWLQFKYNTLFWGADHILEYSYLSTNFLVILLVLLFNIVYRHTNLQYEQFLHGDNSCIEQDDFIISKKQTYLLVAVSFVVFLFVFYINNFSVLLLFFRGVIGEQRQSTSQVMGLLTSFFIRPIPIIIFIYYTFNSQKRRLFEVILFMIAFFTLAPTAVARFQAAALYMPIALIMVPMLRRNFNFSLALILGLLVVFPLLNSFRSFENSDNIKLGLDFSMFLEGHFDAYQNFMTAISTDYISYGRQLLGTLLFFLPRSIWPDKPVGSGYQMAEDLDFTFNNISMPYLAEGYVNFGLIGSVVFVVIMAFVVKRLDISYWQRSNNSVRYKIQYLILLGMLFFMLRGDMMSSFSFTLGMLSSVYAVSLLVKQKEIV